MDMCVCVPCNAGIRPSTWQFLLSLFSDIAPFSKVWFVEISLAGVEGNVTRFEWFRLLAFSPIGLFCLSRFL